MQPREHLEAMLGAHPDLKPAEDGILTAYELITRCFADGRKLLLCGNGGSACDCEHIAGELMKGFLLKRPLIQKERESLISQGEDGAALADKLQRGLPVLVLSGLPGLTTAFANDVDPALCFAQQAFAYARPGDVLMAISTSGNARNVRLAAIAARARGTKAIAFTGGGGGRLAEVCDALLSVPGTKTHLVQEAQIVVYHCLCLMIEQHFFGKEE